MPFSVKSNCNLRVKSQDKGVSTGMELPLKFLLVGFKIFNIVKNIQFKDSFSHLTVKPDGLHVSRCQLSDLNVFSDFRSPV